MVANRTREMRLSGMTRGAYGNVNHGQGLNGHVPRKRRNSQASGLKLRAPYLYPDPRGRSSQPPRPRVMHEGLLARAAVKRSQGRPRAEY
jgi:hypothetical protein